MSHDQKISNDTSHEELPNQGKIQTLLRLKKYRDLVRLLSMYPGSRTDYPKLKYEGVIYKIGQNLVVKGEAGKEYVGKLIRIVNLIDSCQKCIPLVKLRWYYRKWELKGIPQSQLDSISENEVFLTKQTDYIEIESILGLGSVLSFQEYDSIENLSEFVFYTRAKYTGSEFKPSFSQWDTTCICRRPANPDLKYVLCDVCQEWCHLKCVGLTVTQSELLTSFECPMCK